MGAKKKKKGYGEFELSLSNAIKEQLPDFLEGLSGAPLRVENTERIPEAAQGVYVLYLEDKAVYVGKSDAEAGLKARLKRHHEKIQQRKDLDPEKVSFIAVRIYSFSPMEVESLLITDFKKEKGIELRWNHSGFGSNDPGKERDTQKPSRFDTDYPIDIEHRIVLSPHSFGKRCSLYDALRWFAEKLPYTFRIDGKHKAELKAILVNPNKILGRSVTMRQVLERAIAHCPRGWQGTALAGACMLYREERKYPGNPVIIRST